MKKPMRVVSIPDDFPTFDKGLHMARVFASQDSEDVYLMDTTTREAWFISPLGLMVPDTPEIDGSSYPG